jgi:hypothetical protein
MQVLVQIRAHLSMGRQAQVFGNSDGGVHTMPAGFFTVSILHRTDGSRDTLCSLS